MAIYETTRTIDLATFRAICDVCSRDYKLPEPIEMTIRRVKDDRGFRMHESWAIAPPVNRSMIDSALQNDGWVVQNFHGKELLCCPGCKGKE